MWSGVFGVGGCLVGAGISGYYFCKLERTRSRIRSEETAFASEVVSLSDIGQLPELTHAIVRCESTHICGHLSIYEQQTTQVEGLTTPPQQISWNPVPIHTKWFISIPGVEHSHDLADLASELRLPTMNEPVRWADEGHGERIRRTVAKRFGIHYSLNNHNIYRARFHALDHFYLLGFRQKQQQQQPSERPSFYAQKILEGPTAAARCHFRDKRNNVEGKQITLAASAIILAVYGTDIFIRKNLHSLIRSNL